MPVPTRSITLESARDLIRERSFLNETPSGTGRVGVELEWHTRPSPDVATLERLLATTTLPGNSDLSFEPGAQVELSSRPHDSCGEACDVVAADTQAVRERLAADGIDLFASGLDHERSLELRMDAPRYVAMRRFFDEFGEAGGRMMCTTAAIHVNLDAGSDDEGKQRWEMAHLAGPTLLAAFANSPRIDGHLTGWKSSRAATWRDLDPSRTEAVDHVRDPVDAWTDYALSARVMFVREGDVSHPVLNTFRMRDWIDDGHPLGFPDADDIAYHLTTLFPPVRPRRWIELRMIDMVDDPWWRAAVTVTTAIVCDARAREQARDACRATSGAWDLAARCGLEDPLLHASAKACFAATNEALDRIGADAVSRGALAAYDDRYIARGRCPADDVLDENKTSIAEAM